MFVKKICQAKLATSTMTLSKCFIPKYRVRKDVDWIYETFQKHSEVTTVESFSLYALHS